MGILSELRSQRDILERSKSRLNEADDNLTRSSRILRSMGIRAQANKMITAGIAVAAFLAVALILWWR